MIDLHFHLLPGLDDGPADLDAALALARSAAEAGTSIIACTPHILPGLYDNDGPRIRSATADLQHALDECGISISLVTGADNHMVPDLAARLRSGSALSLNDTRYVLVEPPHHILPPRAEHAFFDLAASGYRPILTHPERMGWIERGYPMIRKMCGAGVLMQVTAGAFVGAFGSRAQYWSERLLDDDLVDLVATDAHDVMRRPPSHAAAFDAVSCRAGEERAQRLFLDAPRAILADEDISTRGGAAAVAAFAPAGFTGWIDRWLRRRAP